MTAPIFVDTNILVYARDAGEPLKQARAFDVLSFLWNTQLGRISYQVLNEYYVTVTRKFKPGMDRQSAQHDIDDLLAWAPVAQTGKTLHMAWDIESRCQLSWWDSLIVASALEAGCETIYSEDLQHGMKIDSLRVLNPLRDDFHLPNLTH